MTVECIWRSCGPAVQSWLQEMAPYVKALDPNHLLTIGEEGFYASTNPRRSFNPQGANSCVATYPQALYSGHLPVLAMLDVLHIDAMTSLCLPPLSPELLQIQAPVLKARDVICLVHVLQPDFRRTASFLWGAVHAFKVLTCSRRTSS